MTKPVRRPLPEFSPDHSLPLPSDVPLQKQVCHLCLKAEAAAHLLDLMAECFRQCRSAHLSQGGAFADKRSLLWAPACTKRLATSWFRPFGSLTRVFSFPSEKFLHRLLRTEHWNQDSGHHSSEMIHGLLSSGCLLTTLQNQRTIAGFLPDTRHKKVKVPVRFRR